MSSSNHYFLIIHQNNSVNLNNHHLPLDDWHCELGCTCLAIRETDGCGKLRISVSSFTVKNFLYVTFQKHSSENM